MHISSISKATQRECVRPVVSATVQCKYEVQEPEELISMAQKAYAILDARGVTDRSVQVTIEKTKTVFENSDSSEIEQTQFHTYLRARCAIKGTDIAEGAWVVATQRPLTNEDFEEAAQKALGRAQTLSKAVPCKKEKMTVVLDPHMTGVLSHEAVGHACEADGVVEGESLLKGKVGERIGNELVTIIDDPTATDFGAYAYDDEGIKGMPQMLVNKGILEGYINDLKTAKETGQKPNGHARAMDYSCLAQVRMSNTYFQKGKDSHEDIFDIKKGVYLKGMKGGSVDIYSGGFMFRAAECFEIVNGEITRPLKEATITGNILETLNKIELVGKDFGTSPGICGKGAQEVPVSDGGPHIRIKDVSVG